MKANEAPEKIYLFENPISNILSYRGLSLSKRSDENDIEYTRTDAFIEKALAYLNSKFYFHNAFYGVVSTDFSAMEELFEDFKNYLKGE